MRRRMKSGPDEGARRRPRRFLKAIRVITAFAVAGLVTVHEHQPRVSRAVSAQTPIEHVVILMKENRSFDHYFGRFPGANGATTGEMSTGEVIQLQPPPDSLPNDIDHSTGAWQTAYNNGQMNGFDRPAGAFSAGGENLAYTAMMESQIPAYWAYARRYALGDNMFMNFKGPSFPNQLFNFAAQGGRSDPGTGYRSVYSLPSSAIQPTLQAWGCDTPPDALVRMIAPSNALTTAHPCFTFKALPNILYENGLSWRVYVDQRPRAAVHNALNAIASVRHDPVLWANVRPLSEFAADTAAGTLPAVSWVIPFHNEHPPLSVCMGENDTVSQMNALMNSVQWESTAVFIVWDDWGGFYDHVPPPQLDNISYGFRVPLLVISPWTRVGGGSDGGYVSHTLYSFVSPIKFVETNWNLPSLGAADVGSNDMMELFDFTAPMKDRLILATRACPPASAAARVEAARMDRQIDWD